MADSTAVLCSSVSSEAGVFGHLSSRVQAVADHAVAGGETGLILSIALLATLVGWCLMVYVYRDYIPVGLGVVRGGAMTEKVLDKHEKLFSIYLNWGIALCFVLLGLGFRHWAAGISAGIIWGFQWTVVSVAGALTQYREFAARLFYLRRIVFAGTAILLAPVVLLWVSSGGLILRWLVITGATAIAIMLIVRSFTLFRREGFSISLWILYLCGVEILPILTLYYLR